jgi:hypothetical protein
MPCPTLAAAVTPCSLPPPSVNPVRNAQSSLTRLPLDLRRAVAACQGPAADTIRGAAVEIEGAIDTYRAFAADAATLIKVRPGGGLRRRHGAAAPPPLRRCRFTSTSRASPSTPTPPHLTPPTQVARTTADGVQGAADALGASYLEHLKAWAAGAAASGQLPDLSDPLAFLLSFGGLADAVTAGGRFAAALPELQAAAARLAALRPKLEAAAAELASGGGRCALDKSLLGPLADPAAGFSRCLAALRAADLGPGTLSAGAANYSRWVDVAADLPCVANQTRDFEILGIRGTSLPFPTFYRCTYATQLALPPELIPYVRLRGLKFAGACAAAARAAGPPPAGPAPGGRGDVRRSGGGSAAPRPGGAGAGAGAGAGGPPAGGAPATESRRRRRPAPAAGGVAAAAVPEAAVLEAVVPEAAVPATATPVTGATAAAPPAALPAAATPVAAATAAAVPAARAAAAAPVGGA